jgi:PAS domain S-box-containing protein
MKGDQAIGYFGIHKYQYLNGNDMGILDSSKLKNHCDVKLEDSVSLLDSKAVFLQGSVTYVGQVHFEEGVWVGIQLTGQSIGKGTNDGSIHGKRYFANVGKNNGCMAPICNVYKKIPLQSRDSSQDFRQSQRAKLANLNFLDCLIKEREVAILKRNQDRQVFTIYDREENQIQYLKQCRLEEVRRSRNEVPPQNMVIPKKAKLKFGGTNSQLREIDLEFVRDLEMTQQNFCLSDPRLPDNPITYASQSFLNMTGYSLNEILGKNCRFLQGPETDPHHVHRLKIAIQNGTDCSVCLVNYRADGSKFYNRCYITALRDKKERVKNYIGVQCEVSTLEASTIMKQVTAIAKSRYPRAPPLPSTRLSFYDATASNSIQSHLLVQENEEYSACNSKLNKSNDH